MAALRRMVGSQHHRGPDNEGIFEDPSGGGAIGNNRLSILDLSAAGHQPMATQDGRYWITFNGEIYNYLELRKELSHFNFRSETDTEVLLASFSTWGEKCLDRLIGMFAFAIWDTQEKELFVARDRFGVKPVFYSLSEKGQIRVASEIRTLAASGLPLSPDETTWATYLVHGVYDHTESTFWQGINKLPPGHQMRWRGGTLSVTRWYDIADRVGSSVDTRNRDDVMSEYEALLLDSIQFRFRSDVPVAVALSGGLDSSLLVGLIRRTRPGSPVTPFTFVTGDPRYDELPWVERMLGPEKESVRTSRLEPQSVPALSVELFSHFLEPYGGIPTLSYARLFEEVRFEGFPVVIDGQGMDEQWAGYDYYERADGPRTYVQGSSSQVPMTEFLDPGFATLAQQPIFPTPFSDQLRNLQYRDIRFTKLPRALRFNDLVSMRSSVELREPFLDHRLVELAFRQKPEWKVDSGRSKVLLRDIARDYADATVVGEGKRPVQTPQKEWLTGPLRGWLEDRLTKVDPAWVPGGIAPKTMVDGLGKSGGFQLWQLISASMVTEVA